MDLMALQNDPFFVKFIQKTARMLGEWYQEKAPNMTNEELYADSEFFPAYNPDRDYSVKPAGYVCRAEDGTMMRLTRSSSLSVGKIGSASLNSTAATDATIDSMSFSWKRCWSTNPTNAKEFVSSIDSPYGKDECCTVDGVIYRSLKANNTTSPSDAPESWTRVDLFEE